jgi:hypothetical protein
VIVASNGGAVLGSAPADTGLPVDVVYSTHGVVLEMSGQSDNAPLGANASVRYDEDAAPVGRSAKRQTVGTLVGDRRQEDLLCLTGCERPDRRERCVSGVVQCPLICRDQG